jgi:hypothetical protein
VIARSAPVLILAATTVAATLASAVPALAADVCSNWNIPARLMIHQSNGYQVELDGRQEGNELRGTASSFAVAKRSTMTGSTQSVTNGNFDGKTHGHEFEISVYWSPNSIGVYTAKINGRGRIEGSTHDRRHPEQTATWYADELASCARWESQTRKQ